MTVQLTEEEYEALKQSKLDLEAGIDEYIAKHPERLVRKHYTYKGNLPAAVMTGIFTAWTCLGPTLWGWGWFAVIPGFFCICTIMWSTSHEP